MSSLSLTGNGISLLDLHQMYYCPEVMGIPQDEVLKHISRLALDSLFALAQENPKAFLTQQGKLAGQVFVNGSAAFRLLNGSAIRDILSGIHTPNWKDRSVFWNTMTNTSILLQTGLGCYGLIFRQCSNSAGPITNVAKGVLHGSLPNICDALMAFEECARFNIHLTNLFYEVKERQLELPAFSKMDRAVQVLSVVGSGAMIGKTIATASGLESVSQTLTAVAGVCTFLKLGAGYLASRNAKRPVPVSG